MSDRVAQLSELLGGLSGDPLLQAALVALGTFVLEDPVTIASGLLVAAEAMPFWAAMAGLTAGIAIGDFGLYLIGRFAGPKAVKRGWVSQRRLDMAGVWLRKNLLWTIFAARFLPGSRLPTFVGAGVLRAPVLGFVGVAVAASALWSFALLTATVALGSAVLPLLGDLKWAGAAVLFAALLFFMYRTMRKLSRDIDMEDDPEAPAVSAFEFWPGWVFYLPVAVYCVYLSARFRGSMLPALANPSIYGGGIVRESKAEILSLIPDEHAAHVARLVVLSRRPGESAPAFSERILAESGAAGIALPFVLKPDQGQRGAGVRLVRTREAVLEYAESFAAEVPLVAQELADLPREAGVFWVRRPGEARGRIISLTLKYFPEVVGDGKRTLRELILADRRARHVADTYFARHQARLEEVMPEGEAFRLVFAGNHAQGAIFRDGLAEFPAAAAEQVERIASTIPGFHFGRFDIRFRDFESFGEGRDFKIVELNGASAESTHIWDARMGLFDAYRDLFRQFRLLFEIGAANRALGHKGLGALAVLRDWLDYRKQQRGYPGTT
ncbi:MAG: VTT domain-containing protein [Candidatus Sumerlaeia bacterium]|nr:VTT domain-containing protein [Candidatus Sumerlaeia bacterium]